MIQAARVGTAARAFCVAAILGMALAFLDPVALQGTVMLAAVAATAVAADLSSRLPESWVVVFEAALTSLVIGLVLPEGVLLLPYVVIPALIAGHLAGTFRVLVVISVEVLALISVVLSAGQLTETGEIAEIVGPWLLTALGVGLVSARLRTLRGGGLSDNDESYESARRLLSQLRTVARRLSSGLDTVTMSSQLLATVHQYLDDTHSAVFVRTDGGVLAPLGYRGSAAREALKSDGYLVDRCWAEMEPANDIQPSGRANRRHRVVLPLRVGARMIGVVVMDAAAAPQQKVVQTLMREVDEQALRLDAALAFDEIRSIATMEERHRLAREIHDGVAQEIASLGYVVDDLSATATSDTQRKKLAALRGELTRVVSELRLSIFDLRTEVSAGLGSALSDYVREVGARSGLTVHLTLDVSPTRLRGEVETELFRIAQEAITNARKHSAATNLWVDCRIQPPGARISVSDDGGGLGKPRDDSYGIKIMRERAHRIGAELDISDNAASSNAQGTSVTVTVGAEAPALT
ncbi:MAG: histidine kinase [Nocardioides sp.]